MNKKAFTLIELMAIITILGLLLVLIVPKVKDILNNSKEQISLESTKKMVNIFDEYYVRMRLKGSFQGCYYDFSSNNTNCDDFSFDGNGPDSGKIILSKDGSVDGFVKINDYSFYISKNIVTISDYDVLPGTYYTYDYTGSFKEFKTEATGYYMLEVWGAQGGIGGYDSSSIAGKGGYSKGIVHLNASDMLYVYVGGTGVGQISDVLGDNVNIGGFNGGGNNYNTSGQASSGGGATDIRINTDSLYSRVIVAGGGGGNGYGSSSALGGAGGGLIGFDGTGSSGWNDSGKGGTQSSGGSYGSSNSNQGYYTSSGSFGLGGNGTGNSHGGGAGGGGWYGGGGGTIAGGGGGSSFLYTEENYNNWLSLNSNDASKYLLNSNYFLSDSLTIDGNSSMPDYDGVSTMIGNSGNGYAKITYLGLIKEDL